MCCPITIVIVIPIFLIVNRKFGNEVIILSFREENQDMVNRIRDACRSIGITVKDLEKELGFSNGTIGKWASATKQPPFDRVCAVAEWIGAESYTKRGTANAAPLLLHFDFDFFALSAKRDDLRSVGRWQKHLLGRITTITQPACSNHHLEWLHRHPVVPWVNFDFRRL